MSIVRLLPAWLHAIADYAVGGLLIVLAVIVGGSTAAVATGTVVGAVIVGLSLFTRYPLGVVKIVPFTLHSAGDYLATALLLGAPFVLGFSSSDTGLSVLFVGAGIAVLGVSLITNYQYGSATTTSPTTEPAMGQVAAVDVPAESPVRRQRPLVAAGRKP